MDSYGGQLVAVLHQHQVQACYDRQKDLVYGLLESPLGDIYCLYKQEAGFISSYALFQPEVEPAVMQKVESYLQGLNRESPGGYFYIDNTLRRVVFTLDYGLGQGTDTAAFGQFCLYSFQGVKNHRQLLYWLITGQVIPKAQAEPTV